MPEYMTKSEPVDKKPYIVYTDEKGILYSGDPDSDIPGGGGSTWNATISIGSFNSSSGTPLGTMFAVYQDKPSTEEDYQTFPQFMVEYTEKLYCPDDLWCFVATPDENYQFQKIMIGSEETQEYESVGMGVMFKIPLTSSPISVFWDSK